MPNNHERIITSHGPLIAHEATREDRAHYRSERTRCPVFPLHTGTPGGGGRLARGCPFLCGGSLGGALLTWVAWPSSELPRHKPEASWSWGQRPVVENHPSPALSHAVSIQTGIKAGGKLHRPGGGAPGTGLGDSYGPVSHTYYIRADQERSKATQAQICPHGLGRGMSVGDPPRDTSWNRQKFGPAAQRFLLTVTIVTEVVVT